jgi:DNA-binding MurR/RpiR family transcriptional regulator
MNRPVEPLPSSKTPLTRRQSQLAEYVLQNAEEAIFMTAAQLAAAAGVSDATVVRLAQALGFEGFPELKQHLRATTLNRLDTVARLKRTTRRIRRVEDLVSAVVQQDADNLARTAAQLQPESVVRMARVLQGAEEIGIIGLRSAHSLAVLLASTLGFLGRRARLIVPGTGELWREVSLLPRGAVLVAISFPRYTRLTLEVAEAARRAGVIVASLTDSPLSPLAPLSDHLLTARCRIDSFIESYTAMVSLMNALVTAVAFLDGEKAMRQLRRMEQLWEEKNIYHRVEKRSLPSWAAEPPAEPAARRKKGSAE